MKNNKASTTIGTTLLVTLALTVGYLLLPKVHSVAASPKQTARAQAGAKSSAMQAAQERAHRALGELPVIFEANRGQFDPQVRFASRGTAAKLFLTPTEQVFIVTKPQPADAQAENAAKALVERLKAEGATRAQMQGEEQRLRLQQASQRAATKAVLRVSLAGANGAPQVTGEDELPGKVNYFRGNNPQNWVRDVPTYQRIRYANVYEGIDLVYYGKGRELEYDLIVAPGADPSQISFEFQGAQRLEINPMTGELIVHAANGAQLRQGRPVIYQGSDAARTPVSGGFTVNGTRAGFSVGQYDASRPLVIDPVVYSYSTYLGGEGHDRAHDVAVDADGNAYVVGWTESEEFPTQNAYQTSISSEEAFITKFNPEGATLIWSTYLGGTSDVIFDECFPFGCKDADPLGASGTDGIGGDRIGGNDGAYAVALDDARAADGTLAPNVYITGFTTSRDFPTRNAMQTHIARDEGDDYNEEDAFITKLNGAGNELEFSTYHGGIRGTDVGRGIAVDASRNVYVTGYTRSFAFPTTNPLQPQLDNGPRKDESDQANYDAFLTKVDASGRFRIYSTYLGGREDDVALDVAVDAAGNAYVTGWTDSTRSNPQIPELENQIQEFEVPTENSGPNFITAAPDGQIYFTQFNGNKIGRLNIGGGGEPTFTEFPLPNPSNFRGLTGIAPAATPSNSIYFGENDDMAIGTLDPAAAPPTVTERGTGMCGNYDMTVAPNGRVYYTDGCSQIGRYDPATDNAAVFSAPSSTNGITTRAADGRVYYTTSNGEIVEFDPAGETQIDADNSGMSICFGSSITTGPGDDLFFTGGFCDSRIGRFDPETDTFDLYQIPNNAGSFGIVAGPDGNIYFTQPDEHRIGRLNPVTREIVFFRIPTPRSQPRDIVLGPDGNLYFTEFEGNRIGRFRLNASTPAAPPLPPDPDLFPTTEGSFREAPPGNGFSRDAFVTKVNATGSALSYSTFLGGSADDVSWSIALGSDATAYVTGYTASASSPTPAPGGPAPALNGGGSPSPSPSATPFPTPTPIVTGFPTKNAYQSDNAGSTDAFLTRLLADGSDLIYSTYIGGEAREGEVDADDDDDNLSDGDGYDGAAVAVDYAGNAYITGWTESTFVSPTPTPTPSPSPTPDGPDPATNPGGSMGKDGDPSSGPVNFPTTPDAVQPQPGTAPGNENSRDAYLAKFNTNASGDASLVYSTFLGGPEPDEGLGVAVDPATNAYVAGFSEQDCDSKCCADDCERFAAAPDPAATDDFPTTPGAFRETSLDGEDAFLVELAGGGFYVGGAEAGYIVSGIVTRANGDRVGGVTITLTGPGGSRQTTTGAEGTPEEGIYFFEAVAGGPSPGITYTVTPSDSSGSDIFVPPSQTVVVTNENERADFTATAAPSPSPSPSPSASPSPSPTPVGPQPVNLSTRFYVQPDDRLGIGGFIITGNAPKRVIVRGIGPSLVDRGLADVLPDPFLELRGSGGTLVASNNNWRDTQEAEIQATGIPPTEDLESALVATLQPGPYTALVSQNPGTKPTGFALVEVYDLDTEANSKLGNLSTRAFVSSGDSIVIAGVNLGKNTGSTRMVFRGLGPSLAAIGVSETLQDPTLELRNGEGVLIFSNNNWQENATQAAEISAAGLAPSDSREAAIAASLAPGLYTALLAGFDQTSGNGIVEIYDRGPAPPQPSAQ